MEHGVKYKSAVDFLATVFIYDSSVQEAVEGTREEDLFPLELYSDPFELKQLRNIVPLSPHQ